MDMEYRIVPVTLLQQAAEALRDRTGGSDQQQRVDLALADLYDAMAPKQAGAVGERVMTITTVPSTVPRVLTDADLDAIRALLAELAEPAQEPVAWMHPDGRVVPAATMSAARSDGGALLSSLRDYTIPLCPRRPPLTDEEIDRLWRDPQQGYWDYRKFARAIERAVRGE